MLESALNNIVRHLNVAQVKSLANYVVAGGIGLVVYEIVHGVEQLVTTEHQKSIHAYTDAQTGKITVNTNGDGHKIAEIHKGSNGRYYKWFAGRWHVWNGDSWEQIAISA